MQWLGYKLEAGVEVPFTWPTLDLVLLFVDLCARFNRLLALRIFGVNTTTPWQRVRNACEAAPPSPMAQPQDDCLVKRQGGARPAYIAQLLQSLRREADYRSCQTQQNVRQTHTCMHCSSINNQEATCRVS